MPDTTLVFFCSVEGKPVFTVAGHPGALCKKEDVIGGMEMAYEDEADRAKVLATSKTGRQMVCPRCGNALAVADAKADFGAACDSPLIALLGGVCFPVAK